LKGASNIRPMSVLSKQTHTYTKSMSDKNSRTAYTVVHLD